mmetsp:Transcript_32278/g.63921  ORF Transcript_32278/g.63921 Transcript_32278/m.63921 type:complete len:149 (+) Transcript_32278:255-701(+)|eukprot:CAMPEP_0194324688 /NCGR_PEP_ID=MMETSP0171-20130528/28804_1 /TAXON_ID=218684 /ORGANISM="Corethron pennatum, Strain L29A3" /LENGTH=148 /DNA_ID=CAMNT_0039083651 /DNA_START=241 /DNA_END=687 /DNA_ORIENTATION=-
MPEVKKFVQGERDGAIGYENVSVVYESHAKPILTVFHDSVEVEEVSLSDMQFDAIHAIMVEKGFVKKSADLFDADGNLLIEDADDDDMDDDDDDIDDDDEFDIDDDDDDDMDDDDMDDDDMDDDDMDNDSDDSEDDFVERNEVTGEEL